jgi:hypothetical protein
VSPSVTSRNAFAYEACDIPVGMTIREFRSQRARSRKSKRFWRISRALRRRPLRLA